MKRLMCIFLASMCLLTACSSAATTTAEVVARTNQEIIYGRVTQIYGNDLLLALAKVTTTATTKSSGSTQASGAGQTGSTTQTQSGESRQRPSNAGGNTGGSRPSGGTTSQKVTYTLTGETLSTRIPVGTPVTTTLGSVTTFSRLAVGDTVKFLMEKDANGKNVPIAVWIVG